MKKKLLLLFRRFVPSKRNGGANGNGAKDDKGYRPPQIQWPYVMNSSVPMLGPIVQGSWIWHPTIDTGITVITAHAVKGRHG